MVKQIFNFIGSRHIVHNNKRTCAPPGQLHMRVGCTRLPKILVATTMRSGTHIVIDAILNNFPQYRCSPLYIDLDRLLGDRGVGQAQIDMLNGIGGIVLKTHMPQSRTTVERMAILNKIIPNTVLVTTWRDPKKQLESLRNFRVHTEEHLGKLIGNVDLFYDYWESQDTVRINFDELLNRDGFRKSVAAISKRIHLPVDDRKIVYPPSREKRLTVYTQKFLTRVLGRYAPVINTGIGFRL